MMNFSLFSTSAPVEEVCSPVDVVILGASDAIAIAMMSTSRNMVTAHVELYCSLTM